MFTNLLIGLVALFQTSSRSSAAFFYWNTKTGHDLFDCTPTAVIRYYLSPLIQSSSLSIFSSYLCFSSQLYVVVELLTKSFSAVASLIITWFNSPAISKLSFSPWTWLTHKIALHWPSLLTVSQSFVSPLRFITPDFVVGLFSPKSLIKTLMTIYTRMDFCRCTSCTQ